MTNLREEIEDIIVDTTLHPVDASLRIVSLIQKSNKEEYRKGYQAGYHAKTRGSVTVESGEPIVSTNYEENLKIRFEWYKKELLERVRSIIGNNLPIGDEIAENRSYTGERLHNKIKDDIRQALDKLEKEL